MRFEWRRFVDTHGFDFDPTVAKNNIHVDCPFCQDGEGRRHMGLHLDSPAWGCFKSGAHRGKSAAKLVSALLRCSWTAARSIVDDQDWVSDDFSTMREKLDSMGKVSAAEHRLRPYALPDDLFRLREDSRQCRPFFEYLHSRGLPPAVADHYQLYGANTGEYRWRVVAPFIVKGTIVAATGRHIGRAKQRYHTQPANATDRTVFNYDTAAGLDCNNDALVLVEGPFDAIVLDWLFETMGLPASAVALAGLGYGPDKRSPILELAKMYKRVIVLLDRGAEAEAVRVADDLNVAGAPARVRFMPDGVKDPGEFVAQNARDVLAA